MTIDVTDYRRDSCHTISLGGYPGIYVFADSDARLADILGFVADFLAADTLVIEEVLDCAS